MYKPHIFGGMLLWNASVSFISFFNQKTCFTKTVYLDLLKVLGNLLNVILLSFEF